MVEINSIYKFINENNIDKIYLDMDGVIFASCQAIVDILNNKYHTNKNGSDVISWNFKEICPTLTDSEVESLFVTDEFFNLVKPIQWVKVFLSTHRDKITIVTKAVERNAELKRIWLDKNGFNDIELIAIPLSESKSCIDMSNGLFIDDSTYNLKEVNAKWKVQFREYKDDRIRDWQQDWDGYVLYHWV